MGRKIHMGGPRAIPSNEGGVQKAEGRLCWPRKVSERHHAHPAALWISGMYEKKIKFKLFAPLKSEASSAVKEGTGGVKTYELAAPSPREMQIHSLFQGPWEFVFC